MGRRLAPIHPNSEEVAIHGAFDMLHGVTSESEYTPAAPKTGGLGIGYLTADRRDEARRENTA